MLRPEYLIKFRNNLVTIRCEGNGRPQCSLVLPGGHILSSHAQNSPGQRLLPFSEVLKAEQFLQNTENIADRILQAIAPMTIRHNLLLEFSLNGGLPTVELLETCPALALLLAQRITYDPSVKKHDQVAVLAGLKRQEILRYCSYPAEKWMGGLLQKIPAAQCSPFLLRDLKDILQKNIPKQIKILRHLPQISRLAVDVIKDSAASSMVALSFYHSAATYPETDADIEADYLLSEIIRFSIEAPEIQVPLIRNVRDLQRIHDLYAEQYHILYSGQCLKLVFEPPPIPEKTIVRDGKKTGIFALETGRELYFEGEKMHHCVATHTDAIAHNGNLYAYHVASLSEEEATIMIAKNEITWHLVEIRGYCNQTVSLETLHFVEEWLTVHNQRLLKENTLNCYK